MKTAEQILKQHGIEPSEPLMNAMRQYAAQWDEIAPVEPETILDEVCRRMFVSKFDVRSKCRDRELVDARAVYSKLCKEFTRMSLEEIGNSISKHHSTITHYCTHVVTITDVRAKYSELYRIIMERELKNAA